MSHARTHVVGVRPPMVLWVGLVISCIISLATSETLAGEPAVPSEPIALKGVDLSGRMHHFGERPDTKLIVATFIATECPISNSYLPVLGTMSAKYYRKGVEFYGIVSSPAVTRAEAVAHRDQFRIAFPVLFDPSGNLRRALGATHTPHTMVLNCRHEAIYSGAIDDKFVQLGAKKEAVSQNFLQDAIESALAGERLTVSETKPVGCLLERSPDRSKSGSVTYTRDIAPILQSNCASCHRPGQAGPFSLLTYEDATRHAQQIAEVTQTRYMPPWKPTPGFGRFKDERWLSESEIELLHTWANSGMPEGEPADLPSPPTFSDGWELGEPDVVLEMSETFHVAATGPDIRQYFVIPSQMRENRLISAVDFQPGSPRIVHHASFYLDNSGYGRVLDSRDPDPGYRGFGGPGFLTGGTLRSWLPGMTSHKLPRGMGRLVPRGADLIVEVHYQRSGKEEWDKSKIGLYFASRSSRQMVEEIQLTDKMLEIPAGAKRHRIRASYKLPVETVLLDVAPHMHVLGREVKATATRPDGTVEPLIWIKDWDFNWQSQYAFIRPLRMPKGTRIDVEAWYDNSKDNPLNPNSPPKTVVWGEDSTDEMLICHFQVTCDSLRDLQTLFGDYRKERMRQEKLYQEHRVKPGK